MHCQKNKAVFPSLRKADVLEINSFYWTATIASEYFYIVLLIILSKGSYYGSNLLIWVIFGIN